MRTKSKKKDDITNATEIIGEESPELEGEEDDGIIIPFQGDTDASLQEKGIVFLEDEMSYPGVTLYVKKIIMDIASNQDGPEQIKLFINSNGGELVQFFSLYDTIMLIKKLYKKELVTIVNGIAASAASIISQAGHTRYATKNSSIMIHEVSFAFEGKVTSGKDELTSVKKFQNLAFKIWADSMGISVKELCLMIEKKDLYFSAKEAKKLGLIDDIL
jgi:ATP-dependent Clp protease, protease subunit